VFDVARRRALLVHGEALVERAGLPVPVALGRVVVVAADLVAEEVERRSRVPRRRGERREPEVRLVALLRDVLEVHDPPPATAIAFVDLRRVLVRVRVVLLAAREAVVHLLARWHLQRGSGV